MRTVVHNVQIRNHWVEFEILEASTDPVEPIHEYHIPIPPFKHPPTREDYRQFPRRNKNTEKKHEEKPAPPEQDGHVDDYA